MRSEQCQTCICFIENTDPETKAMMEKVEMECLQEQPVWVNNRCKLYLGDPALVSFHDPTNSLSL